MIYEFVPKVIWNIQSINVVLIKYCTHTRPIFVIKRLCSSRYFLKSIIYIDSETQAKLKFGYRNKYQNENLFEIGFKNLHYKKWFTIII